MGSSSPEKSEYFKALLHARDPATQVFSLNVSDSQDCVTELD